LTYIAVRHAGVNFVLEDDSYVNRVFNTEMLWKEYQHVKTTIRYLTKCGKLSAMNIYIHGRTIRYRRSANPIVLIHDPFLATAGEEECEH
jgi:hypothetical protein